MKEYSILIVDDDYHNLQTLYKYLKNININFKIIKTNRAEKAFKIAINKKPDLIITDWDMPGMSGLQLIESLSNNDITKNIPVIMVTGVMLTSEDLKTSFEAGAIDYISKPVTRNELHARVNSVLKLADSFEEVKKLTKAKDNLIKFIAHDMQASFSGIISIGKILSENYESYSDKKIKELLLMMSDGALKSYELFNQLLKWALTQINEIPFNPKSLKLKNIFSDIEKQIETQIIGKNITLQFEYDKSITVKADETMLLSILQNLISNAIKFSNAGSNILIKVIQNNIETEFSVIDAGVGISEKDTELLFKIESIKSTFGTNKEKGTGIGLILCKEFVEKHNGKIFVESTSKKGSRFYFTLPL